MNEFRERLILGLVSFLMVTAIGGYSLWVLCGEDWEEPPVVATPVDDTTRGPALYYIVQFTGDDYAGTYYYSSHVARGFVQDSILRCISEDHPGVQHLTIASVYRFSRLRDLEAFDSATAVRLLTYKK